MARGPSRRSSATSRANTCTKSRSRDGRDMRRAPSGRGPSLRRYPPGGLMTAARIPGRSRSFRASAVVLADLHAVREVLADLLHFRRSVEKDVGLERISLRVVLVIILALVEALERRDLGDDRRVEDMGPVQLLDVRLRGPLLLVVRVEAHRAVLLTDVWSLPVARRGVVRDREEDLEKLPVANSRRIEAALDGLGVCGAAGGNRLVIGGVRGAAGVAGDDRADAVQLLVHSLDAPEATAREDGRGLAVLGGHRRIYLGVGELLGRDHECGTVGSLSPFHGDDQRHTQSPPRPRAEARRSVGGPPMG